MSKNILLTPIIFTIKCVSFAKNLIKLKLIYMSEIKGKISQIIGPVVDVNFENSDKLPNLLDAIEVVKADGSKVILECQKHIGEDSV